MGLLCKGRDGGKNWRSPSFTEPSSGSSIPAMQARTVLFPAPEAPNNPKELPLSSSNETLTVISRRFFMIWVLSMALALSQDMHQPRKRQGRGEENHEQWHNGRQPEALQIDPKLNRHSGRV